MRTGWECNPEQGFVGALGNREIHFIDQQRILFTVGILLGEGLVIRQPFSAIAQTIELFLPSLAAIAGVQDHTLVPHGPTQLRGREIDVQDTATHWHLGLLPVVTAIV